MEVIVDVVDLDNNIVGSAPRSVVRGQNLLHRGVGILVKNSRGEVYVHRRTATKDVFPSLYDMFVGGVVDQGETYLAAALREVHEELGVETTELEHLFTYLYQGPHNRSWIDVYRALWDGPIRHQPEEVEWGAWLPEADIPAWIQTVEVVPDGLEVWEEYLRLGLSLSGLGRTPHAPPAPDEVG